MDNDSFMSDSKPRRKALRCPFVVDNKTSYITHARARFFFLAKVNKTKNACKRVIYSTYIDLLDRLSSVIESARTLSSNKLFFSRIRQGNVDDDVIDIEQEFESLNVRR